jgi:photosystem II Psb27 protein
MHMKRYLSRLLALVLVAVIGLMGCSSNSSTTGLTGDYRQDTFALLQSLRTAIELPEDAPEKAEAQAQAREKINDFASRYRRDSSVATLSSFTTMRTALNSLAGHYSSYPNRPLPKKLKTRLEQEFQQVENALKRGS